MHSQVNTLGSITAGLIRQGTLHGKRVLLGTLFCCLSGTSLLAIADSSEADAIGLIESMSDSVKQTTYRGTFVHIANGHIESMRLIHANDGESVRERMTSLNGEAREVYRNNSLVTCIWPGSQSVIVSKSKPRDLIPTVGPGLTQSDLYSFVIEDEDRIAGRETHVVSINPKDGYRYGYRFWIDKSTHMMLRSVLLDSDQKSLEEVMFTDIQYPDSIPLAELEADTANRSGYSWLDSSSKKSKIGQERVSFDSLPAGYQKVSESYEPMPMNDSAMSHVMVSDGMASVSVYIEYTGDENSVAQSGVSKMGAMNAYGRTLGKAFVTVVGEVPSSTVRAIGDAVKVLDSK